MDFNFISYLSNSMKSIIMMMNSIKIKIHLGNYFNICINSVVKDRGKITII